MHTKIKYQSNKSSGIILIVFGIVATLLYGIGYGMMLVNLPSSMNDIKVLPALAFLLLVIPFVLGTVILVRASKAAKLMQTGRKAACEIHNVLRVKNGYTMIIKYRGESGTEYGLSVPIGYGLAVDLKAGAYVECYLGGEDAYVDIQNLKVVDKPLD